MKDLNFDELDAAVHSALQADSQATPPVKETPVAPERSASAPVIPTKRRGQFMDMVHPSFDMMRPSQPDTPPVTPPLRRQTTSIQPLSATIVEGPSTEKTTAPVDDEASPAATADPEPAEQPVEEMDREPSEPDHLETTPATTSEATSEPETVAEAAAGPELEPEPETPASEKPLQSPFIEGTEVEKRPLNALVSSDEDARVNDEAPTDEASGISPHAVEPQVELPVELHSDVVAVEADDAIIRYTTDSETAAAQSIVPQYTVAAEHPDAEEHAVFDTSEYHQPLTPPEKPKKSHGVFYISIIVLMLLLGAVAGYLIFVLKLL